MYIFLYMVIMCDASTNIVYSLHMCKATFDTHSQSVSSKSNVNPFVCFVALEYTIVIIKSYKFINYH